jgi:hypothetical protein
MTGLTWKNSSPIKNFEDRLSDFLGFIYEIKLKDGRYYVGRKQFWTSKGYETKWREYNSTSKTITDNPDLIESKEIIGIFTSKSAMRYAEAACIFWSDSYLNPLGLNWSFDSCKGTLKLTEEDSEQLEMLKIRWNR